MYAQYGDFVPLPSWANTGTLGSLGVGLHLWIHLEDTVVSLYLRFCLSLFLGSYHA